MMAQLNFEMETNSKMIRRLKKEQPKQKHNARWDNKLMINARCPFRKLQSNWIVRECNSPSITGIIHQLESTHIISEELSSDLRKELSRTKDERLREKKALAA